MIIGLATRHYSHSSRPEADRALLRDLSDALQKRGAVPRILRLRDLERVTAGNTPSHLKAVLAMTRSATTLSLLEAWSHCGSVVVNSPKGTRLALNRPALFSRLASFGIQVPITGWSLDGGSSPVGWVAKNAWVSHNEVTTRRSRGAEVVKKWSVIQEIIGTLPSLKVYSIGGDLFLPDAMSLDYNELRQVTRLVARCSQAVGLEVCGFDIVYDGAEPVIVDVNDFPAFSGVTGAVEGIADFALMRAHGARDKG